MPQDASRLTQVTREGNCTQTTVLSVRDEEQVLDAVADALAAIRVEYPDDPFDVDVKLRRE